mmetsp:Transcript_20349/g.29448  ORF Transcript_20349/g.29448 Transcript_20349/m.29448 type:complete len:83 (+) Transcript_20349:530-778(+)
MSVVEAVEAVEVEAVEDMILAQRLVAMVGTLAPPLRVLLGVVLRKAGGASHHGGASRHGGASLHGGEGQATRLGEEVMETKL